MSEERTKEKSVKERFYMGGKPRTLKEHRSRVYAHPILSVKLKARLPKTKKLKDLQEEENE